MSGTNSSLSINPAEQSALLYDFVPGGGVPTHVEHVDDRTMQSFYMYNAVPHPSGMGVTFPATTQPGDFQYVGVQITNLTVGATVYVTASFYDVPYPQPLVYTVQETGEDITKDYSEQITFVATGTAHYLSLVALGVHDEFSIYSVSASTTAVSQDSCVPFFRSINDGVVTDTDLDGRPYTAVGEVRTSCPDAQTEPTCACTDELKALQTSVDSIAALFAEEYAAPAYWYCTAAHTVLGLYKSLTVTFINEGTINGVYAPAGYSFSHPRKVNVTYTNEIDLGGTGFAVWEDR